MQSANTLNISVANPDAEDQTVIFQNTKANLNVAISNALGEDIGLDTSTVLRIFMPLYFDESELSKMTIDTINQADWTFSYNASYQALELKYGGTGTWENGKNLSFTIESVKSSASPQIGNMQFNFIGFQGSGIPGQLNVPLTLNEQVSPDNPELTEILSLSLDNQGNVYVSVSTDPLKNTLYLNIKNTSGKPLYQSSDPWSGSPRVNVSFVYGSTSGALAPDGKSESDSVGSAWNISGKVYIDQTGGWGVQNPDVSGQSDSPVWELSPLPNNVEIIGTGDAANVTFAFSNVVSLTPPGHTQMYLQFTGFPQSDSKMYNDALFVLDIVKQNAPALRGVDFFFSTEPIIHLEEPKANIEVPLRWSMYYVDKVILIPNLPGMEPLVITYPDGQAVENDSTTIVIPQKIGVNTPLLFTIQAYDGNGGFLNSEQFIVYVSANFFVDPRDNKVYPTIYINNQTWMAANLNYNAGSGSKYYNNNSAYGDTYGQLYNSEGALENVPSGWRIPTKKEWQALFDSVNDSYNELIAGGASGFNAVLGGNYDGLNFNSMGDNGYYWTSDKENANGEYYSAVFFGNGINKVSTGNTYPNSNFRSIRYVKES